MLPNLTMKELRQINRASATGLLLLFFTGCAVLPPPDPAEGVETSLPPSSDIEARWSEITDSERSVEAGWLESFEDAELVTFVGEVLANNRSLEAALYNLERAAAVARQSGADLKPQINANGFGLDYETFDNNLIEGDALGGSLSVSWELDVWGRVRALRAASIATFESTEADFIFLRYSLVAQTCIAWFTTLEARDQLDYARDVVEVQAKTLEIVEAKKSAGEVTQKEIFQSQANLFSAQNSLAVAELNLRNSLRALELLAGRYPSGNFAFPETEFKALGPVPAGLPSELIERRPDLIATRQALDARSYLVAEAKASRLPRFALTGEVGNSSADLLSLLGDNSGWSVSSAITLPLFTGGALKEEVKVQTASEASALYEYGEAILTALGEVEDALSSNLWLTRQAAHLTDLLQANEGALEISETQFLEGNLDLLSVLQSQNDVISAKTSLISIEAALRINRVELYLALGGSFTAETYQLPVTNQP